jgi:hypothetical protein
MIRIRVVGTMSVAASTSSKYIYIYIFLNHETGMKKHERRRSCGIRRKTSVTWWQRYVVVFLFGTVSV